MNGRYSILSANGPVGCLSLAFSDYLSNSSEQIGSFCCRYCYSYCTGLSHDGARSHVKRRVGCNARFQFPLKQRFCL